MLNNYYIDIKGKKIPVDENVYRAYIRPIWREEKYEQRHKAKLRSLEQIQSVAKEQKNNMFIGNVEEEVLHHLMLQSLFRAIKMLDENERRLIYYRYKENLSQREAAERIGVARTTLQYTEQKVLKKLKEYLENNF